MCSSANQYCIRHSTDARSEVAETKLLECLTGPFARASILQGRLGQNMDSSIRSTLWSAFAVLVVLVVAGLALTMGILHLSNRQEYRIVEGSGPLLMVIVSAIVIGVAAYLIWRIQQSLIASINRQARAERAALAIENAKLYTEQVDARRKVEDLSRLKDEFLSIASHELRTPVTSIKGYTQLAKTLIRENDLVTSEEYLDVALDQIDRMSRLILELLDVSRIETGRLEIRRDSIPWSTFVCDVVHRQHTAVSDRRFQLNGPVSHKRVVGDRDRLEQVFGNLMENAVKYSADRSEIVVTMEDRGNQLVTSVADRGIGIPTDELGQVFERFHRGRQVSSKNYGGLGLGLYITKQIVERHGGTIWVESREGQGTTFSFSLPVATPVAQPVLPAAEGLQTVSVS
jgi:signal transduction histidine kinase